MRPWLQQRQGSAVVALLIVAVLILGSTIMLHTASVIDIQRMERAIEIGRENRITALRVVQAARESIQRAFGPNGEKSDAAFRREFSSIVSDLDDSSVVAFGDFSAKSPMKSPEDFPNWSGSPAPLGAPSPGLLTQAGPQLRYLMGDRVVESAKTTLNLGFSRAATGISKESYDVAVDVRLVAVPLTRFAACGYDLPGEIGKTEGESVEWPHFFSAQSLAPNGLVAVRDRANVATLAVEGGRPSHFRYLAALSEEYQYIFSQTYLQRLVDFAGTTHYLKIGAGVINPRWSGAKETSNGLTLDLGEFGEGTNGAISEKKSLGVVCSTIANTQIVIRDDGNQNSPVLLAIAGPSDPTLAPTRLIFTTAIHRPMVLIGYHVSLEAASPIILNGAVLLDRDSVVGVTAGPFTVGHVSYWQGTGTKVAADAFRPGPLPTEVADLVPRVVYAVATEATL